MIKTIESPECFRLAEFKPTCEWKLDSTAGVGQTDLLASAVTH